MHIITVTTNTASGGDFVSLTASSCPDGWFFELSDSCVLEFVPPVDTLKEMPDEEGLLEFIDAIRLEGEPAFRGLGKFITGRMMDSVKLTLVFLTHRVRQ